MTKMRLSELSDEVLTEVAKIYDKITGAHVVSNYSFIPSRFPRSTEVIKKELLAGHGQEFRFGSRMNYFSYLNIEGRGFFQNDGCLVTFRLEIETYTPQQRKEAEQAEQEFEQAIDRLLIERGLAV